MLVACVLHYICISDDNGDLPIEPQQPNAAENIFARDGHELQGVQLIQCMQQLLNI